MFKIILFIAVATAGLIEWVKHLLPAKVVENKKLLAAISGLISAAVGVGFVFVAQPLFGLAITATIGNILIYAGGNIALVQVSYNVLLQTFKAVKEKLLGKVTTPIDVDATATEIADKVTGEVTKAIEDAAKKA